MARDVLSCHSLERGHDQPMSAVDEKIYTEIKNTGLVVSLI